MNHEKLIEFNINIQQENNNAFHEILSYSEFIEFVCNSANDIIIQHRDTFNVTNTFKIEYRCLKRFALNIFDFVSKFKKRLLNHYQNSKNERSIHYSYLSHQKKKIEIIVISCFNETKSTKIEKRNQNDQEHESDTTRKSVLKVTSRYVLNIF